MFACPVGVLQCLDEAAIVRFVARCRTVHGEVIAGQRFAGGVMSKRRFLDDDVIGAAPEAVEGNRTLVTGAAAGKDHAVANRVVNAHIVRTEQAQRLLLRVRHNA